MSLIKKFFGRDMEEVSGMKEYGFRNRYLSVLVAPQRRSVDTKVFSKPILAYPFSAADGSKAVHNSKMVYLRIIFV